MHCLHTISKYAVERGRKKFAQWILQVGDGHVRKQDITEDIDDDIDEVEIEANLVVPKSEARLQQLAADVYQIF